MTSLSRTQLFTKITDMYTDCLDTSPDKNKLRNLRTFMYYHADSPENIEYVYEKLDQLQSVSPPSDIQNKQYLIMSFPMPTLRSSRMG